MSSNELSADVGFGSSLTHFELTEFCLTILKLKPVRRHCKQRSWLGEELVFDACQAE
jgi:hypothetical protein